MRLYLVELRRAGSRLLLRVLLILAAVNFVVAGVIVFVRHDSDGAAAAKEARAEQLRDDCLDGTYLPPGTPIEDRFFGGFEPGGPAPPPGFGPGRAATAPELDTAEREQFCENEFGLALSRIRRFQLTQVADVTEGLTSLLAIIAIVVGASLIGAEWSARTVTTHLTWETRRVRAFLTKAAAAVTIGAAFFLLCQILEVATLYPSAAFKGTTDVTPGFWGDLFGLIGRGSVAAAVGAGIGFAIASVTTSTVFALGFTFLLSIMDGLIQAVVWHDFRRYSLFQNMTGYVTAEGVEPSYFGGSLAEATLVQGRSPGGAGFVIVGWAVVMLASATFVFRRRDIA